MSTSICGYRGLAVTLPCTSEAPRHLECNHSQVRICLGGGTYQFISSKGEISPAEIHNIKNVADFLGLRATRNCTKAEARLLGFDVDRKPKYGDHIIFFQEQEEIPNLEGKKTMYYGVYRVKNFSQTTGKFGLEPLPGTNPFMSNPMPGYISMEVEKTVMVIDVKEIGL